MKLGLAGFPQTGKRTLFKLLTGQDGAPGRLGVARVRDERLNNLAALYNPEKVVPAIMDFVLLPDLDTDAQHNAAALKGLESVDVICHLIRAFEDDTVFHICGEVDARRDAHSFAEELLLNDLLFVEKRLERLEKERGKKDDARSKAELVLLPRVQEHLEANAPLSAFTFTEEEGKLVSSYPLLTRKSLLIVLNVGEDQLSSSEFIDPLEAHFAEWNFKALAVSAKIEEELTQLDEEERRGFLEDLGLDSPALDRLTQLCYESLGLISFFTVGEDEVRAWAVRRDALAPEAGRAIHTDIEKGFIRVEVVKYEDLIELGDWQKAKEAGKLQQKGRDYATLDGDVMQFLFKV